MAKKKETTPLMYVGPTVHKLNLIQNCVYTNGIPAGVAEVNAPLLKNLFIEIMDYPAAEKMIKEKTGYIWSAFKQALSLQ